MILFVIDEECVNKRVVHHSHTPDSLICSYQMYFWICISLLVDVMKRAASSEQHAASSVSIQDAFSHAKETACRQRSHFYQHSVTSS